MKYNLSNLKYLLRLSLETNSPSATKNVFLHIPKTGINSLVHIIYENHKQRHIYPNYYEKVIKQKGRYSSNKDILENRDKLLLNKNWFIGHTTYNMSERIWPGSRKFSMFREPRARIKSHLLHLLRKSEYQNKNVLEELIDNNINRLICQQATYFGYDSRKGNLKEVEAKIDKLHFAGIIEHFEESVHLLLQLLNWDKLKIEYFNQAKNYSKVYIDLIESKLEHIAIIDDHVYKFALEKFYKQCEKFNIQVNENGFV